MKMLKCEREGNVFTGVCLSTGRVDISGPMSFPGDRYLWYQVPSKGVGMSRGE